jgi:hypothetical protein
VRYGPPVDVIGPLVSVSKPLEGVTVAKLSAANKAETEITAAAPISAPIPSDAPTKQRISAKNKRGLNAPNSEELLFSILIVRLSCQARFQDGRLSFSRGSKRDIKRRLLKASDFSLKRTCLDAIFSNSARENFFPLWSVDTRYRTRAREAA